MAAVEVEAGSIDATRVTGHLNVPPSLPFAAASLHQRDHDAVGRPQRRHLRLARAGGGGGLFGSSMQFNSDESPTRTLIIGGHPNPARPPI